MIQTFPIRALVAGFAMSALAAVAVQASEPACDPSEQAAAMDTGFSAPVSAPAQPSQDPAVRAEAASLDGRYQALALQEPGDSSTAIVIHDLAYERRGGKSVIRILPESGTVAALAFSPDGRWLAAGAVDGTVTLWSLQQGGTLAQADQAKMQEKAVASLSFDPEGGRLLARSKDSQWQLWEISRGRLKARPTPQLSLR